MCHMSAPLSIVSSTLQSLVPSVVLNCLQAIIDLKYLRAQTAAYMLPAMAAEVVAMLRDASPNQLEECRVPKDLTIASFITGGNFLFSPLSQHVITACCRLVAKLRPNSQQVRPYATLLVS
jgi:hypothetical protein